MKYIAAYCATLTLLVLPAVAAPTAPFPDVPAKHWAAGAVGRVAARKLMTGDPTGKFNGNKPVTRYELAVTLDRLVRYMEDAHKPLSATPDRPVHLPKAAPSAAQAALRHLVGGGFLPTTSPIVIKDGTKPVTASELTNALAQVTIRLSDRSLPPQQD